MLFLLAEPDNYAQEHNSFQDYSNRIERNDENPKDKKFAFFLLKKMQYQYIKSNYSSIFSELNSKVKGISDLKFDLRLHNIQDYVFRLSATSTSSIGQAIEILSTYLFLELKKQYNNVNMTFLKFLLLIPNTTVSYLIGVKGKNINDIRLRTGTKIEVFPPVHNADYRQVEISGAPDLIAKASEKIYDIVFKFTDIKEYHDERPNGSQEQSGPHEASGQNDYDDYRKKSEAFRKERSRSKNASHSSHHSPHPQRTSHYDNYPKYNKDQSRNDVRNYNPHSHEYYNNLSQRPYNNQKNYQNFSC